MKTGIKELDKYLAEVTPRSIIIIASTERKVKPITDNEFVIRDLIKQSIVDTPVDTKDPLKIFVVQFGFTSVDGKLIDKNYLLKTYDQLANGVPYVVLMPLPLTTKANTAPHVYDFEDHRAPEWAEVVVAVDAQYESVHILKNKFGSTDTIPLPKKLTPSQALLENRVRRHGEMVETIKGMGQTITEKKELVISFYRLSTMRKFIETVLQPIVNFPLDYERIDISKRATVIEEDGTGGYLMYGSYYFDKMIGVKIVPKND